MAALYSLLIIQLPHLSFFQQRGSQVVVAEAAATLPVHGLGNAAGVLAVDHLLQARNDVGVAVLVPR
ncbi:hypothetical protein GGI1_23706, partial [Acidithiobacillus sp. GGI-221]